MNSNVLDEKHNNLNISEVFKDLYISTSADGLSFRSWEKQLGANLLPTDLDMANLFIPEPGKEHTTQVMGYTGTYQTLRDILKGNHIELNDNEFTKEGIDKFREENSSDNSKRNIFITIPHPFKKDKFFLCIVTPNGKSFSVSNSTNSGVDIINGRVSNIIEPKK